ncbi:MAG TPA: HlyD family efflux transporter periplasmic adaptor subunit [Povalibacter sp.]|uniref:HlyD family efflux transporter periplasmic adaptor subunit n=1 Tax=Povalibacter sp. TaxID=1962978 RepID=UPI002B76F8F6|nr:HlyD family efflux transporter periplasmic adaptor subunit [Povalibacter sp.]HMN43337.1 HlyD family efflux transporter periplasmic adaptor subunit [Povalibacter sp.]
MIAEADQPLPPLREDLQLIAAANGRNGEPSWVIQDSVLNRFYRIGWFEFECLLRWTRATARQVCEQIAQQTALKPDVEQILGFRRFLQQHHLVRPDAAGIERLQQQHEGNRWLNLRWWLHHYLFFRIPLLRPQRWLQRIAGRLDWLFTRTTAFVVICLGLLGIALVLHQWDTFTHAVVESFSTAGLLSFAVALIVAKTLHELGHALVATRMGLKVAHMGIAFVVLWPMLYTDTGESWKLRSSRQRLAIASAGILSELALAGLATLGWAIAEPGFTRNALLYLATTSWVLSLALNASPFMRFDGYFILSDLLDFPNLHERSFALARVWLRRYVLGLDEPWPEPFPPSQRRALIAFAFLTWLYRLALFVGIAIAVYLLFFKALGIVLFAVEIAWFVVLPVWRELRQWWERRAAVRPRRRYLLWTCLGLVVLLLAIPWRSQVHGPGVARSQQQLRIFAPYAARIAAIRPMGTVAAGDTLATFEEPDITARMHGSEASQRGYEARLAGLIADREGLDAQAGIRERLHMQMEETRASRTELQRLTLQAPFAGQWRDVDHELVRGQWIDTQQPVGMLIDPDRWLVDAYVEPDEVHRIHVGSAAQFFVAGRPSPIAGHVLAVASTRARQLSHPMLAARNGGPIRTAQDSDMLMPNPPLFHVLVQLEHPPAGAYEIRGDLHIEGDRRSLLADGLRHLLAVFVRESGF